MSTIFIILFFIVLATLVLGMINPKNVSKDKNKPETRKHLLKILGIPLIIFFVLAGITAPKAQQSVETSNLQSKTESTSTDTGSKSTTSSINNSSNSSTTGDKKQDTSSNQTSTTNDDKSTNTSSESKVSTDTNNQSKDSGTSSNSNSNNSSVKQSTSDNSSGANDNAVVYMTKTGDCYHNGGCSSLRKSKIQTTVKDAKAAGLRPCSKCHPPE